MRSIDPEAARRVAAKLVAVAAFASATCVVSAAEFRLTSKTLEAGERMPPVHVYTGCGGEDVSP